MNRKTVRSCTAERSLKNFKLKISPIWTQEDEYIWGVYIITVEKYYQILRIEINES